MTSCLLPDRLQKRDFWSTQPDACGSSKVSECGEEISCGDAGLKYVHAYNPCDINTVNPCGTSCPPKPIGVSIANNDRIRGLIMNILLTKAAPTGYKCRPRVGFKEGYWADSFREDGLKTGSQLWNLPTRGAISDLVKLIKETIRFDLSRIVSAGVASEIIVNASYQGSNQISLNITGVAKGNPFSFISTGSLSSGGWEWV